MSRPIPARQRRYRIEDAGKAGQPKNNRVDVIVAASDLDPPLAAVVVNPENSGRRSIREFPVQRRKQPIERFFGFLSQIWGHW